MRGISAKLLLALVVSVTLPLSASVVLLALAVDSSFQVGVNRRVHDALERAPEAYRALFDALKDDFAHSTDGIVASPALLALLDGDDEDALRRHLEGLVASRADLVEIRLLDDAGEPMLSVRREPEGGGGAVREWEEERALPGDSASSTLVARWGAPRHLFESFQAAGETLNRYETLEQGRTHLRNWYVAVYLAMVGAVFLVALGLGVFMSRRVTTRITRLADATRQVAGGDLTTRVPEGPRDEVGQLANAFNTMVERLHESRERIEYLQRVAAWQQLARRLAHEIKNPLTPIQLAVQELSDRYEGDDPEYEKVVKQVTEIVTEEVEALRRLTSDFSAFAKLPAVSPSTVRLRAFLEDASQALVLLQSDNAEVVVELPSDESLAVSVDKMLMRRVLDNLVRNAVEAVDLSGRPGTVTIRAGRGRDGGVFIAVEDDGPSIGEDDKSRIFEPYFTTKDEGTGLGLAIVKKIVLEHDGTITLESPPAGGARFVIRLYR